uniref:Uncharacterized protein n=1 Tax=Rhizophora mucronata TaxID=61149 RepID=A0A2P2QFD4_RHIMU
MLASFAAGRYTSSFKLLLHNFVFFMARNPFRQNPTC